MIADPLVVDGGYGPWRWAAASRAQTMRAVVNPDKLGLVGPVRDAWAIAREVKQLLRHGLASDDRSPLRRHDIRAVFG